MLGSSEANGEIITGLFVAKWTQKVVLGKVLCLEVIYKHLHWLTQKHNSLDHILVSNLVIKTQTKILLNLLCLKAKIWFNLMFLSFLKIEVHLQNVFFYTKDVFIQKSFFTKNVLKTVNIPTLFLCIFIQNWLINNYFLRWQFHDSF